MLDLGPIFSRARDWLMAAMFLASVLCVLGAIGVYTTALDDRYFYSEALLALNTRSALVLAYALASAGVSLWIVLWRMLQSEHARGRALDSRSVESAAPSALPSAERVELE